MTPRGRLAAGIVGCLTLLAIGWTGLLVPSLIRSIKETFDQTDAGIGVIYLAYALAYATASFGGGALTERLGRRLVLGGAVLIHGAGIAGLGLAPTWTVFVAAALVAGAGAGCLDGGANGLVLDVYREGRGRAMNLLHVSFGVGALAAPLIVGALVDERCPVADRRDRHGRDRVAAGDRVRRRPDAEWTANDGRRCRTRDGVGPARSLGTSDSWPVRCCCSGSPSRRTSPSEVGVSNWLVRFLEPAPLTTATLALSLYWAGLTVGRLALVGHRRPVRPPALHDRRACSRWPPSPPSRSSRRRCRSRWPPSRGRRRLGSGLPDDRGHRRRSLPGALGGGRRVAHGHGRRRVRSSTRR